MHRHSVRLAGIISAGGALLALVTAGATIGGSPSAASVTNSKDAAIAAVRTILAAPQTGVDAAKLTPVGDSDLTATGPVAGALFSYYEVSGHDVWATVDVRDSHVAQLLLLSRSPATASARITGATAQTIAMSWLKDHGISTDGLNVSVTAKDRGAAATYVVSLQRIVNGTQVPDSRLVELDAGTGVVFLVNNIARPYVDPPAPKVDRDTAVSAARSAAGAELGVAADSAASAVESADLRVTFNSSNVQKLVWQIGISISKAGPPDYQYLVEVDALTGTAAITGRG